MSSMANTSDDGDTSGVGSPDFSDVSDIPVGLSDPQYVRRKRKMLDAVNRLRAIGAHLDLDIPVIVVLGSQSAGKSSLIEAISGIRLPRASGTCTRCPTICQLSNSLEPWRCIVSLQIVKDENGVELGQPRRVEFGDPIFDKLLVTDRINRAQCAILNPNIPSHSFLEDEIPGEKQLTFSSNSVCLEIRGRDVDDLSFVDLPGLIPGGDRRDSRMVEQLATQYISRESCIILSTIACETDFENQGAHALAAQYDPRGTRTIGVLTKPDRIPTGEEGSWIRRIQGYYDEEEGGVKYFSVKNPDSQDIKNGITYEQARQQETKFFTAQEPWSSLDWGYQQRLGTEKLTKHLGQALSDLISKRLPELEEELNGLLERTAHELSRLPNPPSSEPVGEMLRLINSFVRSIEHLVDGVPDENGLIQTLRGPQMDFKKTIRGTAPDLRPFTTPTISEIPIIPPPPKFLVDEDAEWQDQLNDGNGVIYIDEVMKIANAAVTRELPNNFPFIVKKNLIGTAVKKWDAPSKRLFDVSKHELQKRIRELIEDQFSQYAHGGLKQRVINIMHGHIQRCADAAEQRIDFLLEEEREPFTMNVHSFMDYRSKFLGYYKGIRQRSSQGTFIDMLESNQQEDKFRVSRAISSVADLSLSVTAPSLTRLLPLDSEESAIEIMAEVRAYFQVAFKRFMDNVPMTIDHALLCGVKVNLESVLFKGVDISGPGGFDRCAELLSEPEDIVARRDELQKRRGRLASGRDELLQAFE